MVPFAVNCRGTLVLKAQGCKYTIGSTTIVAYWDIKSSTIVFHGILTRQNFPGNYLGRYLVQVEGLIDYSCTDWFEISSNYSVGLAI